MNNSSKPNWIQKREDAVSKINESPQSTEYRIAVQGRTEMARRLLPILNQTKLQVQKLQVVELGLSIERAESFEEYLDDCAIDRAQESLTERASLAMVKILNAKRVDIGVLQWKPYDANSTFRSEPYQAIADQVKIVYEDWRTGVIVVKDANNYYPLGTVLDENLVQIAQSVADEILYCFARDIDRFKEKDEVQTAEEVKIDTFFVDPDRAREERESRKKWRTAGLYLSRGNH